MWEMILIYIIGVAALIYMTWFLFFPRRKKSRCAGCPESETCKKRDQ